MDDKWLSALHDLLGKELGRVGQILSSRLAQLAARYSMAMPTLVRGFENLSSRVDGHLKQMGFSKPIDDARGSAIQELVAGRVRIQGFSEPWVPRRLDSLGSFLKGRGVMRDQANSGSIACVRYGEIYTTHHDIVRGFTSWISPEVAYTATRLKKGDILFAGSGETKEEIGKCVAFVDDCEAYAGGDIVILRPRGVDSRFLGYALNAPEVNRQKANFGQGDAVVHISAAALGSVTVLLPPLDEQSAIADVLSTLDADLAALDALSDKTRELRHGMMQALLTGRIRLV